MTTFRPDKEEITFLEGSKVQKQIDKVKEKGLKDLLNLHVDFLGENGNKLMEKIIKETGIELLSEEEIENLINLIKDINLETLDATPLLSIIHSGRGKLDGIAAAILLKSKAEKSKEIILKLRKLLNKTKKDKNNNQTKTNTDKETGINESPQLTNESLNNIIQSFQKIASNPEELEKEFGPKNIDDVISESKDDNKKKKVKNTDKENDSEIKLPELGLKGALQILNFIDDLGDLSLDDRLSIEFIFEFSRQKIWNLIFDKEEEIINLLKKEMKDKKGIAKKEIIQIIDEYKIVKNLKLPEGFNPYWKDTKGNPISTPRMPFLMQRYEMWQMTKNLSRLNTSDAGCGKSLTAAIASQKNKSRVTVVFCPLVVIHSVWEYTFEQAFPEIEIKTRTWSPEWSKKNSRKVLINNYDLLRSEPKVQKKIINFAKENEIDFIILDEAHKVKQRGLTEIITDKNQLKEDEDISARRIEAQKFLSFLRTKNPKVRIYGMTASPSHNDLSEPISLLSLIEPTRDVSHLKHDTNIANALKIHQELVMHSTRWRQAEENKPYKCKRETIKINNTSKFDDLIKNKSFRAIVQEQHSLECKIKELAKILSDDKQTIIFVHHVDGIVKNILTELRKLGFSIGAYYGADKSGKDLFLKNDIQILVASMSAIGTGFDGLQENCSKAIFFAQPWTYEIRKQCEARIARTGQTSDCIFLTLEAYYEVDNPKLKLHERIWSWDKEISNHIQKKRNISNLVVDGEIENLNKVDLEKRANEARLKWIERLEEIGGITYQKRKIVIPIIFKDEKEKKKRLGKYGGELSSMNRKWNTSLGKTNFERVQANPEEFEIYHTIYHEAENHWPIKPIEKVIEQMKDMEGCTIADFGCGTGRLMEALGDEYKVLSFDVIGVNEKIIECNIANQIPLGKNSIDIGVFCLSLMGKDWPQMINSSRRVLKPNGQILIWATKKQIALDEIKEVINNAGFQDIKIDYSDSLGPFFKVSALVNPSFKPCFKNG